MNSNLRGTYRKMFLREEGFSMESPRSNQLYTDFGWSVLDNGTAVIPVVGTLGDWNPYSYITGMIEDALSMEKVDSIVLIINSPGCSCRAFRYLQIYRKGIQEKEMYCICHRHGLFRCIRNSNRM